MKTINISGVISDFEFENESNVTPGTLRNSLKEAGGDDLLITINSPGGSVYQGLEMFSLIKNYEGKVETRIVSLAASMGSVLALAGDKKTAESTAGYMIHNPWTVAIGDYRALKKQASDLEKLSGLFTGLYEKNTTLTGKEAAEYMDEETYFFGKEIEGLGFEIIDVDGEEDKATAAIMAKASLKEVESKMTKEEFVKDIEKAAASIAGIKEKKTAPKAEKLGVAENNFTAEEAGEKEARKVETLKELQKENPDLYAEAVNIGKEAGIKAERERRNSINEFAKLDPENEGLQKVCLDAIETGAENDGLFQAKANLEIQKGTKLEGENAPTVATAQDEGEALSKEELEIAKALDLTPEEMKSEFKVEV